MIIDLLTQVPTIIKYSYYDYLNSSVISDSYTIKTNNDIMSWKITNPSVSSATITIISDKTRLLKDIQLNIVGGISGSTKYKIYTSIDYCNWYELEYFYYNFHYFKKINDVFVNYDNTLTDLSLLENIETNATYAFKKVNAYNNTENYIYDNLQFKYIKVEINNISANSINPVFLSLFNIYVDDIFNTTELQSNILKVKSNMFTPQKIFEDETFIPDCILKYMSLLEEKNPEIYTNLLTSSVYFGDFITNKQG